MARLRLAFLLVLGVALSVATLGGCDRYGDDIDAVKVSESILPGTSNDALTLEIAGARGTVQWKGVPAPQYESPDIVGVQAVIKRIGTSGKRHEVELDFVHNRQTKMVGFDGMLVDGEKQDLISALLGGLGKLLLQLE